MPVNLIVAEKMLLDLGYQVDTATGGAEALGDVRQRHYDLIFMDVQMPDMDGLEATRRIRALGREASQVPIVALTANSLESDRLACIEAGMNDFVAKPFAKKQLFRLLERYFPSPEGESKKAG